MGLYRMSPDVILDALTDKERKEAVELKEKCIEVCNQINAKMGDKDYDIVGDILREAKQRPDKEEIEKLVTDFLMIDTQMALMESNAELQYKKQDKGYDELKADVERAIDSATLIEFKQETDRKKRRMQSGLIMEFNEGGYTEYREPKEGEQVPEWDEEKERRWMLLEQTYFFKPLLAQHEKGEPDTEKFIQSVIDRKLKVWQEEEKKGEKFKSITKDLTAPISMTQFFELGGVVGTFPRNSFTNRSIYYTMKANEVVDDIASETVRYVSKENPTQYVELTKEDYKSILRLRQSPISANIIKIIQMCSKAVMDKKQGEEMPSGFYVDMNELALCRVLNPDVEYDELFKEDAITHKLIAETKEEATKRVENARKNAQKTLDSSMRIIYSLSIPLKRKDGTITHTRIFQAWEESAVQGYIRLYPTELFYRASVQSGKEGQGLVQYSLVDMEIGGQKTSEFAIMQKMREHYTLDANKESKTNNRLTVRTLYRETQLPSYEECKAKGWRVRMQAPFEKILDELVENRNILSWEYRLAGDKPLTSDIYDKNHNIKDVNLWFDMLIRFEVPETDEQIRASMSRLKKRAERKASPVKKKRKYKKRASSKSKKSE